MGIAAYERGVSGSDGYDDWPQEQIDDLKAKKDLKLKFIDIDNPPANLDEILSSGVAIQTFSSLHHPELALALANGDETGTEVEVMDAVINDPQVLVITGVHEAAELRHQAAA